MTDPNIEITRLRDALARAERFLAEAEAEKSALAVRLHEMQAEHVADVKQSHRWREQLATSCEKRDRLIDEIIRLRKWQCNCNDPKQEPCPVHESQAFKAQMQAMRDADQVRRTVGVGSRDEGTARLREDPVQPVGEGKRAAASKGDAAVSTGDRRQEVSTPAQPAHAMRLTVDGMTVEEIVALRERAERMRGLLIRAARALGDYCESVECEPLADEIEAALK